MELNDALRRIVGQHWRLLGGCLLVGLALGVLLAPHGKRYSASARVVLDTPDPVARQQSEAYADTAKAIATSPSAVGKALREAGAARGDAADYAGKHVAVRALGSSGVMEISVTDRSRGVAASVANTLAKSLIQTRLKVSNGEANRVFADLDKRITGLSQRIATIDTQVSALDVRIASADASSASALRAQRDAAESTREFLAQQRAVVQSERVSLLSTSAQHPLPSIISPATPPTKAAPSHRMVYVVLGALLGLILGVGAAGLLETVRPTLVGGDTLAGELDSALLGMVGAQDGPATSADVTARLRLAAEAVRVRNVALVAAGPAVDLDGLARSLKYSVEVEAVKNGDGTGAHSSPLRISSFDPAHPPFNNGSRSGLVLVSPTALKKTDLADVEHLLQASRLPLLGVITYEPGSDLRWAKDQLTKLRGTAAE